MTDTKQPEALRMARQLSDLAEQDQSEWPDNMNWIILAVSAEMKSQDTRIAELEAENRALKVDQARAGMLIDPDPTPQIAPSGHVFHTAGIGTLKGAWEVGWNAACDHHDIKSLREQIAQQEAIGAGGVTGLRANKEQEQ